MIPAWTILEEEDARTLAALAFGEKAWMDSDVKTQYQERRDRAYRKYFGAPSFDAWSWAVPGAAKRCAVDTCGGTSVRRYHGWGLL